MTKEESIKKAVSILLTHMLEEGGEVTIRIGNSPTTYIEQQAPYPPRYISKEDEPVKKTEEPVKDSEPTASVAAAPSVKQTPATQTAKKKAVRKRTTKAPASKKENKPTIISVFPGVRSVTRKLGLFVVTPGEDLLTADRGDSDALEKMYSYEGAEYILSPSGKEAFFEGILKMYESSDKKYIVVPFGKVVFDNLDKMNIPFCVVYPADNEDNRAFYFKWYENLDLELWHAFQKIMWTVESACSIELLDPSDDMEVAMKLLALLEESYRHVLNGRTSYKGCCFKIDCGGCKVEVDKAAAELLTAKTKTACVSEDDNLPLSCFLAMTQEVEDRMAIEAENNNQNSNQ